MTGEDPRLIDRDALVADLVARMHAEGQWEAPEIVVERAVDGTLAALEAAGLIVDLTTPDEDDEAGTGTVRTLCDVPEDGYPVSVVEVVKYLDADTSGESFLMRIGGDCTTSEVLSLLESGKFMALGLWPS